MIIIRYNERINRISVNYNLIIINIITVNYNLIIITNN